MKLSGGKIHHQKQYFLHSKHSSLIVTHFYFPCRCTFKNIFDIVHSMMSCKTVWRTNLQGGHSVPSAPSGGRKCHCSRVTTSTAWPSNVTVLSMRVATGAMATWTGRLPWARLVTTVWYMLTGIWTRPEEKMWTWFGFRHTAPAVFY